MPSVVSTFKVCLRADFNKDFIKVAIFQLYLEE